MDWENDWLHGLIFQEVARAWAGVRGEGGGTRGTPPGRFYIQRHARCTADLLTCAGPAEMLWAYDGAALLPLPAGRAVVLNREESGMFWGDGLISFHITPDRAHVVWNAHMGRRYARGYALRVLGEGSRATLERDGALGLWVV